MSETRTTRRLIEIHDSSGNTRTEYDATGQTAHTAVVTFTYDARKRLILETRVVDQTQTVYALGYEYDQLGNRTHKTDLVADRLTCYVYDTDWDPVAQQWRAGLCFTPPDLAFATRNNRLIEYREYGPESGGSRPLERTVAYTYYATGLVSNIAIKDEHLGVGDPEDYNRYHGLTLYYRSNGMLWLAAWEDWEVDPQTGEPENRVAHEAWEFRYDSGRQRYFARRWNTPEAEYPHTWYPDPTATWTDYLGQQPYGDYDVELDGNDNPVTTERLRYLAGFGVHVQQTLDGQNDPIRYLHGDLIRSTMLTTDETGSVGVPPATLSYTAFGEVIGPTGEVGERLPGGFPRYAYAGGWGYESGPWGRNRDGSPPQSGPLTLYGVNPDLPPITLQHVGWRWYQPDTGRFIQRDPIGIRGGLNIYLYCGAYPLVSSDPAGLATEINFDQLINWTSNQGRLYDPGPAKYPALAAACIWVGVFGGAALAPGAAAVWTVQVITRASPGADGATAHIIITRLNGVVVSVRHVVIRAGEIIHDHITYIGKYGGRRTFPPGWQ